MRVQLYIVLWTSLVYFGVILVASHITHSLALLVSSYQILCRVISLIGFIFTIKKTSQKFPQEAVNTKDGQESKTQSPEELEAFSNRPKLQKPKSKEKQLAEQRLMNTFGWARIYLLFLLASCVFLASLCFSVIIEAVQTLIHISHHDEMHHSVVVLCLGILGILINIFSYGIVGGFIYQDGSILRLSESGNVFLETIPEKTAERTQNSNHLKNNLAVKLARDNLASIFVIFCGIIVYFTEESIGKFVDPILALISTAFLVSLNFPFMKEACLILLLSMPNHIDLISLKTKLLVTFPQIVNVHDLHIWQLTEEKIILTAHITFHLPQDYKMVKDDLQKFFLENRITKTTIQPEFLGDLKMLNNVSTRMEQCLVKCDGDKCQMALCCSFEDDLKIVTVTQSGVVENNGEHAMEEVYTPRKERCEPDKSILPDCDEKTLNDKSSSHSQLPE